MARLRYTTSALADLNDIARYIARVSGDRATAERFDSRLRAKCRQLAASPFHMGRPRPELQEGMRSTPYRRYVIFFRYESDVLEIVNILEGHRDIEALFGDEEA